MGRFKKIQDLFLTVQCGISSEIKFSTTVEFFMQWMDIKNENVCKIAKAYVCLKFSSHPNFGVFNYSNTSVFLLVRISSYLCGWAEQSAVCDSCSADVWPGRLGRLVHPHTKTFSVSLAAASWDIRTPIVTYFLPLWKLISKSELHFLKSCLEEFNRKSNWSVLFW